MKHFNRNYLAMVPLLSLLSMSPSVMQTHHYGERFIASVTEEVSKTPKFDSLASKVDPASIVKIADLTVEKFKAKKEEVVAKLAQEKQDFKKEQSDKAIVEEQRKKVEGLIVDILLVDSAKKEILEKLSPEEKTEVDASLLAQKEIVEGLITDLEANEILVAKAQEPKKDEPVVVAEEPKKEEPKKEEEPKKDEPVVASEEPKKEEDKKEDPKKEEEKKAEVCEAEEKNKVLNAQVTDLMKQNEQIMKTMMGMMQMMISMHQQSQNQAPNPYYQNSSVMPSPYQYNQPTTAGNWVYYPQGFQPQQQNIFAPQQQQMPVQGGGFYPDQVHSQQSGWNLQPTYGFDPRFQQQPMSYGTFGNDPFSFNMMNQVPTVSQNTLTPQVQPPGLPQIPQQQQLPVRPQG